MPFGLKNARATYQRLVNMKFNKQIGRNMEVYVNDMLVNSVTFEQHVVDLMEAFDVWWHYKIKLNPTKCIFGVSLGKFFGFMVNRRGIEANMDKIKAVLQMESPRNLKQLQCLNGQIAVLNQFISLPTDKCLPFFKILRTKGLNGQRNVNRYSPHWKNI